MDRLIAVCLAVLFLIFHIGKGIEIQEASGSSITYVSNVSIECKSERYGVVFKLISQNSSDTIRLAECQFGPGGHSQLMNASFRDKYNVTYIHYTCILTLLYLSEDHCGLYTCSEMYNETETIQKQISLTCNDVPRVQEQTKCQTTIQTVGLTVLVIFFVQVGVCIITWMFFNIWRKKICNTSSKQELITIVLQDAQSQIDDEEGVLLLSEQQTTRKRTIDEDSVVSNSSLCEQNAHGHIADEDSAVANSCLDDTDAQTYTTDKHFVCVVSNSSRDKRNAPNRTTNVDTLASNSRLADPDVHVQTMDDILVTTNTDRGEVPTTYKNEVVSNKIQSLTEDYSDGAINGSMDNSRTKKMLDEPNMSIFNEHMEEALKKELVNLNQQHLVKRNIEQHGEMFKQHLKQMLDKHSNKQ